MFDLSLIDPLADLNNKLERTRGQLEQSKNQLQIIYKSRTWRFITIIRVFKSYIKGLFS